MIKIFITEDQELYLEGLTLLLNNHPQINVCGTAVNATALLQKLESVQPDILLLDVHLPDMEAEELLKKIRAIQPTQKIIYLTMMRGTRYIHRLIKHQIQGYLLKNARPDELYTAIEKVQKGEQYFSKDIDIMGESDFRSTITINDIKPGEILSKREIEILQLVCKEYSNSEIADKLFLSISTVETHRKNLIAKLGVSNTVGLVKFALKNKLIE
jgi:two-component system, NarL family, response regulator NreC